MFSFLLLVKAYANTYILIPRNKNAKGHLLAQLVEHATWGCELEPRIECGDYSKMK